jgi:hypothetical protein
VGAGRQTAGSERYVTADRVVTTSDQGCTHSPCSVTSGSCTPLIQVGQARVLSVT